MWQTFCFATTGKAHKDHIMAMKVVPVTVDVEMEACRGSKCKITPTLGGKSLVKPFTSLGHKPW